MLQTLATHCGRVIAAGLLLAALLFAFPSGAAAQEVGAAGPATSVSSSQVEAERNALDARIKEIEGADLSEDARQKRLAPLQQLRQTYTDTLAYLKSAEEQAARAAQFRQDREAAPGRLQALQAQSAPAAESSEPQVPAGATLPQLEQLGAQAQADLAEAKKQPAELDAELQRRADRRVKVPVRTAEVKRELEDVAAQLALRPPADEPAELTNARNQMLHARQRALEAELNALAEEIRSYDATREIVTTHRDRAAQQVTASEKLVAAWNAIINRRRMGEATQEVQRARQAVADALPPLKALAEQNERLAEERTGPNGPAAGIQRILGIPESLDKRALETAAELDDIKKRVKAAGGFTKGIGLLLLRKREELADVRQLRQDIRKYQGEMSRTELQIIDVGDRRRADVDAAVSDILKGLAPTLGQSERDAVEAQARQLLQTRRQYLDDLGADLEAYFHRLDGLLGSERALLNASEKYAQYIDEHILWVQSAPALSPGTFPRAFDAGRWLFGPRAWASALRAQLTDVRDNPVPVGVALLVLVTYVLSRRRLHERLTALGEAVQGDRRDRFGPTLHALIVSLLTAGRWPVLLLFLSWRLASGVGLPEFVYAVASGIRAAAFVFLVLEFLRVLCQAGGLADRHFRMRSDARQVLVRNLLWFVPVVLPLIFVFSALAKQANEVWEQSLGRLAFMLALMALSAFAAVVLRPSGQVMKAVLARRRGGWLDRLRYVWQPLGAGLPFALAVLAGLGYYYSAQQLERRLEASILLLVSVLLLSALLVRWLLVARIRIGVKRAQEERQRTEAAEGQPGEAPPPAAREEEEESLYALSQQTRRLLRILLTFGFAVGLYLIWVDVLPALNVLKGTVLWTTTVGSESIPITLASMTFAMLAIVVMVIANRNLPGLLEIAVLQHLPLERGVRFAVTTLSRYAISVIGVVVAFNAIGIGWSKVQWLIAAMTFGLGFGLQEIFANFVSGMVILFERPMRVGDTVTVGDTTGTVTRIRIRATTILDWDRRELVVPNKEFITGRLVNWTLSDTIHRMLFPVGIAYGSDTKLAEQVLLRLAREEPHVLDDPPPVVVFKGFGDSALDFELRVFIPNMEAYVTVWHALNMAIDEAFRKEGIEIAFPQRDVHIRSIDTSLPVDVIRQPREEERGPGNGAPPAAN